MNSYSHQKKQYGFTVIEMIVVISIFSILGGMLLFNYKGFERNQEFSVFAQEVGLLIKEQQQDAMAGKFPEIDPNFKTYPPLDWKPAYGVYLKKSTPFMIKFYDTYNDPTEHYSYTVNNGAPGCTNPDDECLKMFNITNGREIIGIYKGGYGNPGAVLLNDLTIVFERPYPDAHMRTGYQTFTPGSTGSTDVLDTVDIVFQDVGVEGYNVLTINPTGAISIRRDK